MHIQRRQLCGVQRTYSNLLLFLIASVKKTASTWHMMKEIWAELGYRGLFAGKYSFCLMQRTKYGAALLKS